MKGKVFLIFVGLMVAGAGGVFAWLMWGSYQRAVEQRGWAQVEGLILSSEVEEWRHDEFSPQEYQLKIVYGYEWEGQPMTGDQLGVRGNPRYNKRDKVEALVEEFPVGGNVKVYVNPKDTEQVILKPDSKAAGYSLWFPLLFVVGGMGMVIGAVRRKG